MTKILSINISQGQPRRRSCKNSFCTTLIPNSTAKYCNGRTQTQHTVDGWCALCNANMDSFYFIHCRAVSQIVIYFAIINIYERSTTLTPWIIVLAQKLRSTIKQMRTCVWAHVCIAQSLCAESLCHSPDEYASADRSLMKFIMTTVCCIRICIEKCSIVFIEWSNKIATCVKRQLFLFTCVSYQRFYVYKWKVCYTWWFILQCGCGDLLCFKNNVLQGKTDYVAR